MLKDENEKKILVLKKKKQANLDELLKP